MEVLINEQGQTSNLDRGRTDNSGKISLENKTMANFFKDYQNEVRLAEQEREKQEREQDKKKMTLDNAIWDILTDMSGYDVIEFLSDNGYIDLYNDAEQYAEDLEGELENYIILEERVGGY